MTEKAMQKHRPGPKPGKHAKRNTKIIECYLKHSAEEAAKRFKLSKAAIYKIVRAYRAQLQGNEGIDHE